MTAVMAGVLLALACVAWPRRPAPSVLSGGHRSRTMPSPAVAAPTGEGALAVAEAMDLLALALSSGAPVVDALEAVGERSGPLVCAHLRHVAAALRWGVEPVVAWRDLPEVWAPASQAMSLASTTGVPPAQLLRSAADDVRTGEERRLEEAVARLSVRIVIPLGLCFLPAFGLLTVVPIVAVLARDVMAAGL